MATPAQDDNTSDTTPQEKQVPKKRGKKATILAFPPDHFPRTELEVANLVVQQHGPNILWCKEEQCLYSWNGKFWESDVDEHGRVYRWTRATVIGLLKTAATMEDDAQRQTCIKIANQWQKHTAIVHIMQSIKADVEVHLADFDTDPWLLNLPSGTLELRTGNHREHRRGDLISKVATDLYAHDATCPNWEDFMLWVCQGDTEFVAYQQRLMGSCLTGVVRDQAFIIDHGMGGNGKTVKYNCLARRLGTDYAVPISVDSLIENMRKNGGAPSPDIMKLKGARVALAGELEDGQHLAEGKVKLLTGGDRITARSVYGKKEVDFSPSHKLIMYTNHAPIIRGTDKGIWRRVKQIPSHADIEADVAAGTRQKRSLDEMAAMFEMEGSGILNWLVKGCLEWQQHGLGTCKRVEVATAAYKKEMDLVGIFLGEYLPTKQVLDNLTVKEVYDAYRLWCDENGRARTAYSKQRFNDEIRNHGGETERGYVAGFGYTLIWKNLDVILAKMNAAAAEAARKDDPSHATSTPPANQGPAVACPSCGQTITDSCVTGDGDGKIAACPGCGRVYSVKFYFKGAF
jgi:putative DNA primase/helicase